MAQNTIQGNGAILYVFTNEWIEYACVTTYSIQLASDLQSIKTIGDGWWAKNAYKGSSYSISLNNITRTTIVDDTVFSGYDFMENFLNHTEIQFRITYTDDVNNIKSIQGSTLISQLNFNSDITNLVSNDITLVGNGEILFFDGTIPCPVTVDTITVTGQTSGDGDIAVTYTYTGPLYQVKYRLDGNGPYSYALLAAPIGFQNLTVGTHSVEIIALCQNGYVGNSISQTFEVTYAMTCDVVVTGLLVTQQGTTILAQVNFNKTTSELSGTTLKYSIDSHAFIQYVGVLSDPTVLYFTGLTASPNPRFLQVVPTCANGVDGTGADTTFTVISGPVLSAITYSYSVLPPNSVMQIYKNGILIVSGGNSNISGTFSAVPSDSIVVSLGSTIVGPGEANWRHGDLQVQDTTNSVIIHDSIYNVYELQPSKTINYTFTPTSGHNYAINCSVIAGN